MMKSWLFLVVPALLAAPLSAQQAAPADSAPVAARRAGVLLPGDHWAAVAVRRLEGMGLAEGFLPVQRSVRVETAGEILCAAAGAETRVGTLARAWCERFREEFPQWAAGRARAPFGELASAVRAGYGTHHGGLSPGKGTGTKLSPPVPLADDDRAVLSGVFAAVPDDHLELSVEPALSDEGVRVPRWNASLILGPVAASVRRRPVGYGYGTSGVTLSEGGDFTQFSAETIRPVRLPGWLRAAGPVGFHLFATRLREERHAGDPYLAGLNVVVMPHPRLVIEGRRAAIFGGDSVDDRVTPRTLFQLLVGTTERSTDHFENQFASAEIRLRLPTERTIPLTLYLEWGADDFSARRSFVEAPTFVAGVSAPSIPGAEALQLGAEYTYFGDAPGPTYRHDSLLGNWVSAERPLGRPLGGEGREALMYGTLDLFDARVRVRGQAFRRHRGPRNLYSPNREGASTGAAGTLLIRAGRLDLDLRAAREQGTGWTEQGVQAGLSLFL